MSADDTVAGLAALSDELDGATFRIVADVLHLFQAAGMRTSPIGTPGNTTNAPGDLARSWDVQGPVGGGGIYGGKVGPTTVYGRQRELGGAIYPVRARYLRFVRFGMVVYTKRVFQYGEHYALRAYLETRPLIPRVVEVRLGEIGL